MMHEVQRERCWLCLYTPIGLRYAKNRQRKIVSVLHSPQICYPAVRDRLAEVRMASLAHHIPNFLRSETRVSDLTRLLLSLHSASSPGPADDEEDAERTINHRGPDPYVSLRQYPPRGRGT